MIRSLEVLAGGASLAPLLFGLSAHAQAVPASATASGTGTASSPIPIETVTASYVRTPLADTPANVTILTARQMQEAGDVTLTQALRAVPGLHVTQSGNPGAQASVFIEGSNSEDVQVLRDGIPINDPSNPNGAFNFGGQSLADVARIAVVRGPMSGLYGSGAIGGVINLISRKGSGAPHLDYEAAAGFPGRSTMRSPARSTSRPASIPLHAACPSIVAFPNRSATSSAPSISVTRPLPEPGSR
jgi:vitamin B12 transporter